MLKVMIKKSSGDVTMDNKDEHSYKKVLHTCGDSGNLFEGELI